MISFLEGIIEVRQPTHVVLNVGGVGYEVLIPLSSFDRLPREGERCRLLTHDLPREDEHLLLGFATADERSLFRRLVAVSGIGPKTALSALSGLSPRELKLALTQGDVKRLSSITGIGPTLVPHEPKGTQTTEAPASCRRSMSASVKPWP